MFENAKAILFKQPAMENLQKSKTSEQHKWNPIIFDLQLVKD